MIDDHADAALDVLIANAITTKPTRAILVHVSRKSWRAARDREREDDIHPCGNYRAKRCMCKGACGCHWEK